MAIIKITKQNWETIDPTKTNLENYKLNKEYTILFNTNEMITATASRFGGTSITYKKAMVDSLNCKETLEEIYKLINK
jgi:maltodextrin utilization protein YvdJ